jgi:hypothetical protein
MKINGNHPQLRNQKRIGALLRRFEEKKKRGWICRPE